MFRPPYAISPLLRRNAQPAIFVFVALHLTKSCLFQICFQRSIRVDGHTVDNLRPVIYGRASPNIFRKALTQSPNSLACLSRRFWRNFALSFPSRTTGGNQRQQKISLQFCRQRQCLIQIRVAQNAVGCVNILPCHQQPNKRSTQRAAVGCPDVTTAAGLEVGFDLFVFCL